MTDRGPTTDLLDRARAAWMRLTGGRTGVLVGTSGGPDSQALLDLTARLAAELGLTVHAAGVDHGLRPRAGEELELAAALAARHGIAFARLAIEVDRRGNLLANARQARYAALLAHADAIGAAWVAVAHTATDQAETLLFRLARGTALRGARAIRPKNGRIVRPLLEVTRPAILAYLAERGISYADDPSNHDPRRARARLRAEVLPVLECLHPQAVHNLARFTAQARRDEAVLSRLARRELDRRRLAPDALTALEIDRLPPALRTRVVRSWLAASGVCADASGLTRVLRLREGAATSIGGRLVRLSRGCYYIVVKEDAYCLPLPVPGRAEVPELGLSLVARLEEVFPKTAAQEGRSPLWSKPARFVPGPAKGVEPLSSTKVAFDADALHLGLWVRPPRPGDRLRPFGLAGSMKVGDLFTNTKAPTPLRRRWPLVVAGDAIAWVVGLRRSELAPITPMTRRALVLEVDGTLPWSPC